MDNFNELNLPSFLIEALKKLEITIPTPIQAAAIPFALQGRDILASAQTGTGKTIAYLLPIVSSLINNSHKKALILTPTRELAIQVKDMMNKLLGREKNNLQPALLIGGDSMFKQLAALKKSPQMIIGTPGRILDHLNRRTLKLRDTQFLVLDETDRMLDMGFSEPIKMIVDHLTEDRQTMMFSATLPPNIVRLSKEYLKNPECITIGSKTKPVEQIIQKTINTKSGDKYTHLLKELEEREGSVIIFVKTKISADRLAGKLQKEDHQAEAIHGDLRQSKRERVIRGFRNQKNRILVATDVAARGLDVPHVMHVINFDLPQCPEDYIHRIGRTGRAGAAGNALSFIAPEDMRYWKMIMRLIESKDAPESPGFTKNRRDFGSRRDGKANRFDRPKKFDRSKKIGNNQNRKDNFFGHRNKEKNDDDFYSFDDFPKKNQEPSKFSARAKSKFENISYLDEKPKTFNPKFSHESKKPFGFKKNVDSSEKTFKPRRPFGFKKDLDSSEKNFKPKKTFGFKNNSDEEKSIKKFGNKPSFGAKKPIDSKKPFRPKFWSDKYKANGRTEYKKRKPHSKRKTVNAENF